ncbi:sulfotransferase domain-containing protein [Aliagarivorans marinus]|uniref:sulfotransferase domain-containing protein n=1 Tax=Aliagarivorans marinus TaxID=561965 RepID=UPI0004174F15|nr:sulfotransferase domain-containing protein [Aliagarivorans marinus]
MRTKVEFLGVGVQKCASTWIHALLSRHPEVNTSETKELDFFSNYFDRGYSWYEAQFSSRSGIRGENSPSYFYNSDVPARVHAYNSQMKIVVLLRNPIERTYSNHLHEISKKHISRDTSFSVALANNPLYVEQSYYARHLERWLTYFPKEQLLVLFQEDIKDHGHAEAQRLFRFLAISDHSEYCQLPGMVHESVYYRSDWLKSTLQRCGRGLDKVGGEGLKQSVKQLPVLKQLYRVNKTSTRTISEQLSEQERRHLTGVFGPEVQRLVSLLGLERSPWSDWL